MSRILDQINDRLAQLSNDYAAGNAHGLPVTDGGELQLTATDVLQFDQEIKLNEHTGDFLRNLAVIIDEFYG